MAQRFLEVDVSRTVTTTITIAVDDEDERFRALFDADGKLTGRGWHGWHDLKVVAQSAPKMVSHDLWDIEGEVDVLGMKAVTKEEAMQYEVWDAQTNRVLER